jgi:3-oxoacyl-[acyl-carrier-protein] synthase III
MTAAAILGLGSHRPAHREDNHEIAGRTDSSDE